MWRVWAAVAAGLLLVACSAGGEETDVPSYEPVSDSELYARIAEIGGVREVDVTYSDTFTTANSYAGDVHVTAQADPARVLDRVLAILRQGHPGAALTAVYVRPPGEPGLRMRDLGLVTQQDLAERYGPQPGSGQPPDDPPTVAGDATP